VAGGVKGIKHWAAKCGRQERAKHWGRDITVNVNVAAEAINYV
jgi:hypothetical protein